MSAIADLFPETVPVDDDNDERYTTTETVEWILDRLGIDRFDLDAAACEESHHADTWYDRRQNGLLQPWFRRTFINPPYSDIEPWAKRAHELMNDQFAIQPRLIAMLVPATRTEQPWWQKYIEPYRDRADGQLRTLFLAGRTSFAKPGSNGVGQDGAPFGCVLVVWRRSNGW